MQRVLANRVTSLVKAFVRNKLGSIILMSALLMPVLIGFVGLGLDVTIWYMAKRQIQTAADAGAIAAAHTMAKGNTDTVAKAAADVDVALNAFVAGGSNTVVINIPPSTGAYTTDSGAAETYVTLSQPLYFMSLFGTGPIDIQARGVAAKLAYGDGSCVLGLHPTAKGTVEFSGTSDVIMKCGITSNSNAEDSLLIKGSATLDGDPVNVVGDITIQGTTATFTYDEPPVTYTYPAEDPYASLTVPTTPVACNKGDTSFANLTVISAPEALTPGRYCGGLKILDTSVTFAPGVYIFDRGDFITSGASTTLDGTGVTFIFTATDGAGTFGPADEVGGLHWAGQPDANLSAPNDTTDPYHGILFYQDQRAECCSGGSNLIANQIVGGSNTNFVGAMYFPNQELFYAGGSDTVDSCMVIVANKVTFNGTANVSSTEAACAAVGIDLISQSWVRLVE